MQATTRCRSTAAGASVECTPALAPHADANLRHSAVHAHTHKKRLGSTPRLSIPSKMHVKVAGQLTISTAKRGSIANLQHVRAVCLYEVGSDCGVVAWLPGGAS
jgi:hypothetical protein